MNLLTKCCKNCIHNSRTWADSFPLVCICDLDHTHKLATIQRCNEFEYKEQIQA